MMNTNRMKIGIFAALTVLALGLLMVQGTFPRVAVAQGGTAEATAVATVSATVAAPAATAAATNAVPRIASQYIPTPVAAVFPKVRTELRVAQQDFERGFMFWLSTTRSIWVLIASKDNPEAGEWRIYKDTFADGEAETDATLKVPETLFQPKRGFGKVWRDVAGLRDALGWATTPEFELVTTYVYQPGGVFDGSGNYSPSSGVHFLTNLSRQLFMLYETPDGLRWQRLN